MLYETLTTYNNSINSATKLTPFELFSGRTHILSRDIKLNSEHDFYQKLNEFQNLLYRKKKSQLEEIMNARIDSMNKDRTVILPVETNNKVFRKEN